MTLKNRRSLCIFYHQIITKCLCWLSLWYICSWNLSLYIWVILPPSASDARWRRGSETKRLMKQLQVVQKAKIYKKMKSVEMPFPKRMMVEYCISLKFLEEKKKLRENFWEIKLLMTCKDVHFGKIPGYHLLPSVYVTPW